MENSVVIVGCGLVEMKEGIGAINGNEENIK